MMIFGNFITFPSPYGVTVIKSTILLTMYTVPSIWFPSPYGVTVIKSIGQNRLFNWLREFPSPYGVTVIKSRRKCSHISYPFDIRFRPLTG